MTEAILPHAQEFMYFSLIAQAAILLVLVLIWLELRKKK